MNLTVDYDKEKRRAARGIVAWAMILALALSIGLAGWFFFLDAWAQTLTAQKNQQWFDQWEDGAGRQDSYKCWEMTGLSEEFAVDFKETYHYYFAFDSSWNPVIVKMKGELEEKYQPYKTAVYVEGAELPEPFTLRGVAAPIENDIREFAIESLNILFDGEVISEDDFEELMGVSFLDTTRKPRGNADFSVALGFGMFAVLVGGVGVCFLVINVRKRKNLELAWQRELESIRQAAAWQDAGEFGGGGGWNGSFGEPGNNILDRRGGIYPESGSRARQEPVKKSNRFLGILGAAGSSLLGVGLWILVSLTGFIAGFAGLIMLKCALKGYEKLSGKLDKMGIVISLVTAAVMVFFANELEYVIALCRVFWERDASIDTIRYVVLNFGELMTEAKAWGGFYMNLILGYVLSICASYKTIWKILTYREP